MDYIGKVEQSLDFIHRNISEDLTIDSISQHIFLSKFHFHRIFHSLTGESIMDYVRKYRLEISSDELIASESRIVDIALKNGFSSQEHFMHLFKKYYGITPGEFRKNGVSIHFLPRKLNPQKPNVADLLDQEPLIREISRFTIAGVSVLCNYQNFYSRAAAAWKKLISVF